MNIFAYLDPGSGSLILQVIIGGVLGFGVILKTQWSRIIRLFSKKKKPAAETKKSSKSDTDSE